MSILSVMPVEYWYWEPSDFDDEDDDPPPPPAAETLTISHAVIHWTAAPDDEDES